MKVLIAAMILLTLPGVKMVVSFLKALVLNWPINAISIPTTLIAWIRLQFIRGLKRP